MTREKTVAVLMFHVVGSVVAYFVAAGISGIPGKGESYNVEGFLSFHPYVVLVIGLINTLVIALYLFNGDLKFPERKPKVPKATASQRSTGDTP